MTDARLQQSLRTIINELTSPAVIVDYRGGRAVELNSAADACFELPLGFSTDYPDGATRFLKPTTTANGTVFVHSDEDSAEYVLYPISDSLAVMMSAAGDSQSMAVGLSPEALQYPNFHFSYLHRILSGQRMFPDPDQLVAINLVNSPDAVEDLDWRQLIVEEDLEVYDQTMAEAVENGGNYRLRYRVRSIDGHWHEVTDFFSVIHEQDKWPLLSGTIISTQGAQQKIQEIERLCLVGRLVGGMTHDFRNLLAGMQNMMEWCMAKSPADGPVYKAMEKTINYSEQASNLIRSTLRLIHANRDVELEAIPVKELIDDARSMIVHFGNRPVSITVDCGDAVPPIIGQRSMLLDILLNLSLNACDAMAETGGTLAFRVNLEECPDQTGKLTYHVAISVSDDGCGMTDEQMQLIFNDFFTTKKDGAGLGLWMVRQSVQAMGGKISVKSQVGVGSEFKISLPLPNIEKKPEPDRPVHKSPAAVSLKTVPFARGKTVLFIEDEPLLRGGVESWLKSMGFTVITAEDGETGLQLFEKQHQDIDLIILDYVLPGVRGDTLLKKFVADAPRIPVIICSGFPDGRDSENLRKLGATALLPKPFPIEKLIDVIAFVFDEAPVTG